MIIPLVDNIGLYLGYARDVMADLGLLPIIQAALGAAVIFALIAGVVRFLRQA